MGGAKGEPLTRRDGSIKTGICGQARTLIFKVPHNGTSRLSLGGGWPPVGTTPDFSHIHPTAALPQSGRPSATEEHPRCGVWFLGLSQVELLHQHIAAPTYALATTAKPPDHKESESHLNSEAGGITWLFFFPPERPEALFHIAQRVRLIPSGMFRA